MSTPHCPVCQRWNDPTGGPDAHSGGCDNVGQPYPQPQRWVSVGNHVFDPGERVEVFSWDRYEVQPA